MTLTNHGHDVMAFVRYEAHNYVVSLNVYDGFEQWHKVLSGLAPGPVQIVLLAEKDACPHDTGVTIVDRRSFLEAMKIVERIRQKNDVLRFVLYPVKNDTGSAETLNSEEKKPATRHVHPGLKAPMPGFNFFSTAAQVDQSATTSQVKADEIMQKPKDSVAETCPKWATEMKNELFELIEERFQQLSVSMEQKLSLLGSQISGGQTSLASIPSITSSSLRSSSASLLDGSVATSGRPSPYLSAGEFKQRRVALGYSEKATADALQEMYGRFDVGNIFNEMMIRQFEASELSTNNVITLTPLLAQWLEGMETRAIRASVASLNRNMGAPSVEEQSMTQSSTSSSSVPEWIEKLPSVSAGSLDQFVVLERPASLELLTPQKDTSDCGSVVVVTPPESLDVLELDTKSTLGDKSEVLEMASHVHNANSGDHQSETGESVVYVETDGEEDDEEDFSHLRSWAGDNSLAMSNSQNMVQSIPHMSESCMSKSGEVSLQASFHSTISDQQEPVFHETIVYKPLPLPPKPVVASGMDDNTNDETTENGQMNQRPVPVNGSDQLPVNLNAMQSLDDQNLFSPNSDLGTMLLSAASSIATGFMQSMESLSKAIQDRETQRRTRLNEERRSSQGSEPRTPLVNMDEIQHDVTVTSQLPNRVDEPPRVAEVPHVTPPPVPPRGPRAPQRSGLYMSVEEIIWYLNEFGAPELLREPWAQQPLTRDQFNTYVNEHFDSLA